MRNAKHPIAAAAEAARNAPKAALLLVGAALTLAACSAKPACQQIASKGRSVASAAATAQMIAERWIAHDVPTSYAHNTLRQGAQQVERATVGLEMAPDPAPQALARYRRLAAVLVAMNRAVKQGDAAKAGRFADALPGLKQQIDHLRARCEAAESAAS